MTKDNDESVGGLDEQLAAGLIAKAKGVAGRAGTAAGGITKTVLGGRPGSRDDRAPGL
ncbi:hypothetical protein [Actinomadura luteofluorescens]|uniref:hypothetical protein n=1 Tax=Actinomadura luteofluorescens TaxID=46163 RepID=UPI003D8AB6C0